NTDNPSCPCSRIAENLQRPPHPTLSAPPPVQSHPPFQSFPTDSYTPPPRTHSPASDHHSRRASFRPAPHTAKIPGSRYRKSAAYSRSASPLHSPNTASRYSNASAIPPPNTY